METSIEKRVAELENLVFLSKGNDEFYCTDSIVISRDHIVKLFRITVSIADTDKRDSKCMSLLYADSLFLRIYDKDSIRGVGKVRGQNAALRLEVVRQMSVVVERDAIGRELKHLVDRFREGGARLLRQPVDEVHVDGFEPVRAGRVDRGLRLFEGLDAVDRLLHVGIEVLNAAGHAVETEFAELLHFFGGAGARVDFDREFAARGEREALRERFHHVRELVVREERGSAAAEVQLCELLRARDVFFHEVGFAADRLDVFGAPAVVARHDLVAAAVVADVVAEGNVNVEGQIDGILFVGAPREGAFVVFNAKGRIEPVGRGVGRVARGRHVEFA